MCMPKEVTPKAFLDVPKEWSLVLGPLPIVCVVPTSCSAVRCVVSTGILWSEQSGVFCDI